MEHKKFTFGDYLLVFGSIAFFVILLILTVRLSMFKPCDYTLNSSVNVLNNSIQQQTYNYTDGFYIIKIVNHTIIDRSQWYYESYSLNITEVRNENTNI